MLRGQTISPAPPPPLPPLSTVIILVLHAFVFSSSQTDDEYQYLSMNERPVGARRQGRKGPCACGGRTLSAGGGTGTPPQSLGDPTGTHPNDSVTPGDPPVAVTLTAAPSTSTVCRSCQARRSWLDSFSARLLVVACRKVHFPAIQFVVRRSGVVLYTRVSFFWPC